MDELLHAQAGIVLLSRFGNRLAYFEINQCGVRDIHLASCPRLPETLG